MTQTYTELLKDKIIQAIKGAKIVDDFRFTLDFKAGAKFMQEEIIRIIKGFEL